MKINMCKISALFMLSCLVCSASFGTMAQGLEENTSSSFSCSNDFGLTVANSNEESKGVIKEGEISQIGALTYEGMLPGGVIKEGQIPQIGALTYDSRFKTLLKNNKDLFIEFLNKFYDHSGDQEITSLEYIDSEHTNYQGIGTLRYDLCCEAHSCNDTFYIIVEMQRKKQINFENRLFLSATKFINSYFDSKLTPGLSKCSHNTKFSFVPKVFCLAFLVEPIDEHQGWRFFKSGDSLEYINLGCVQLSLYAENRRSSLNASGALGDTTQSRLLDLLSLEFFDNYKHASVDALYDIPAPIYYANKDIIDRISSNWASNWQKISESTSYSYGEYEQSNNGVPRSEIANLIQRQTSLEQAVIALKEKGEKTLFTISLDNGLSCSSGPLLELLPLDQKKALYGILGTIFHNLSASTDELLNNTVTPQVRPFTAFSAPITQQLSNPNLVCKTPSTHSGDFGYGNERPSVSPMRSYREDISLDSKVRPLEVLNTQDILLESNNFLKVESPYFREGTPDNVMHFSQNWNKDELRK